MAENRGNTFGRQRILEDAATLRKRLANGMLYGIPIDPENADMMIVAAFAMGRYCESKGRKLHDVWADIPDF
jgi:hypothetical protein